MLNSEIDTIEEQNRNIERQIEKHEHLAIMSHQEKDRMRAQLTKEIENMQGATRAKEEQINGMEQQMVQIKGYVEDIVGKFREAHQTFPLMVAKQMAYEPDTQFNE